MRGYKSKEECLREKKKEKEKKKKKGRVSWRKNKEMSEMSGGEGG